MALTFVNLILTGGNLDLIDLHPDASVFIGGRSPTQDRGILLFLPLLPSYEIFSSDGGRGLLWQSNCWDFTFQRRGVGSIPAWGTKIPHASWPKNQTIKQKQCYHKFNKDFKNGLYKKIKKNFWSTSTSMLHWSAFSVFPEGVWTLWVCPWLSPWTSTQPGCLACPGSLVARQPFPLLYSPLGSLGLPHSALSKLHYGPKVFCHSWYSCLLPVTLEFFSQRQGTHLLCPPSPTFLLYLTLSSAMWLALANIVRQT